MKIEIGETPPPHFTEAWPGQFHFLSHLEVALGIPQSLFLITTLKANAKPNACFQSWTSFSGDGGGFFAVTPVMNHCHTHANIRRTGEFCINFLGARHYDACWQTVAQNGEDTDEIAAAGFTAEPCRLIGVPRIREAFLSLECRLHSESDLSGKGITTLMVGRVVNAALEESHLNGSESKYGPEGFTFLLNDQADYTALGNTAQRKLGALKVVRTV